MQQPEREAIVDLLNLCVFADANIALSEDQFVENVVRTLNWDPKISFDYYEGKSIGEVRRVKGDPKLRAEFLKTVADRLSSKAHRKLAFDLSQSLFAVDGVVSGREAMLTREIRQVLGIQ